MEQPNNLNKKLVLVEIGILAVILMLITLVSILTKKNNSAPTSEPTKIPEPTITAVTLRNNPVSIEEIIKVEPTLLTPIPLPNTLQTLQSKLAMPMKYKSISIRYSPARETYIIYHSATIFDAQKIFAELLSQYGVTDGNEVKTEYVDNNAPLQERPPAQ